VARLERCGVQFGEELTLLHALALVYQQVFDASLHVFRRKSDLPTLDPTACGDDLCHRMWEEARPKACDPKCSGREQHGDDRKSTGSRSRLPHHDRECR